MKTKVQFLNPRDGSASPEGVGEVELVNIKEDQLRPNQSIGIMQFPKGHSREGEMFEAQWNQTEKRWEALPM